MATGMATGMAVPSLVLQEDPTFTMPQLEPLGPSAQALVDENPLAEPELPDDVATAASSAWQETLADVAAGTQQQPAAMLHPLGQRKRAHQAAVQLAKRAMRQDRKLKA